MATSMDELMSRCNELGIINVEHNGALSTDIITDAIASTENILNSVGFADMEIDWSEPLSKEELFNFLDTLE